jgi:hypothetical protein
MHSSNVKPEVMTDSNADRLKEEGNILMKENKPLEAIAKYVLSQGHCAARCHFCFVISAFDTVAFTLQVH